MTQIYFRQIPAGCEQLLAQRRYEDALKMLDEAGPQVGQRWHTPISARGRSCRRVRMT